MQEHEIPIWIIALALIGLIAMALWLFIPQGLAFIQ